MVSRWCSNVRVGMQPVHGRLRLLVYILTTLEKEAEAQNGGYTL